MPTALSLLRQPLVLRPELLKNYNKPNNHRRSGSGATFDVTPADGVVSVAVNAIGDGYEVGDTLTILGSAIGGTDGVNDLTISVAALDPSSMVSFGSQLWHRIDTARFSGSILPSSSASFTLSEANGTTSSVKTRPPGVWLTFNPTLLATLKKLSMI